MKNLLLIITSLAPFFLFGQRLTPSVWASAGSNQTSADGRAALSFTVGETAIASLSQANVVLGQGFHNGTISILVGTSELDLESWKLNVFPIPTLDELHIQLTQPNADDQLQASLLDVLGQPTGIYFSLGQPGLRSINLEKLAPGAYFLHLRNKAGHTGSVRIMKL